MLGIGFSHAAIAVAYHVSANVNQYVILHDTRITLSGSQMPLVASSSVEALDARSIGTRRTIIDGNQIAKKSGTM